MKKTLFTIAVSFALFSLAFGQGPGGPGAPGGPGGQNTMAPNTAMNQPVPNPGIPNGGPGGGPFGGSIFNNPTPAPNPVPIPNPAPAPAPAPPSNALQCLLGGVTYWLANGLFYTLTNAGTYTTTSTPPIGLIVPRLSNAIQISWAGYPAYLSNHVVYRPIWTAAGREFKVVGYLG